MPHDRKAKIFAKVTCLDDDGYCTVLGFADEFYNPVNYVTLQMGNEPDAQDLRLGVGGIHIEAGALDVDGYDLVEDIRETDTGVVVSLRSDAAQQAGIDQDIEIEMESKVIGGSPAGEAVRRFRERLAWWERTKAGYSKAR
jgi:hypothetical protein